MDFQEMGKKLSQIRKDKKISQQNLADNLNISTATISSFENGAGVDIGLRKVIQIVDYLDLEIQLKEKSPFPTFEELLDER